MFAGVLAAGISGFVGHAPTIGRTRGDFGGSAQEEPPAVPRVVSGRGGEAARACARVRADSLERMTTPAFVVPPLRLSESDEDRLREYGLSPEQAPVASAPSSPGTGGDAPAVPGASATPATPAGADDATAHHGGPEGVDDHTVHLGVALSTALSATAAVGRGGVIVVDRGRDDRLWRRDPVALVDAATSAAAGCAPDSPLVMVLLPAVVPPRRGPVAVLSPPGAASSYELVVGAALAAASGRRVEHLNGRGLAGSVTRSAVPARVALHAEVSDWREHAQPRPERSLHELTSRPAAIVLPVVPGSGEAPAVVADHPDADVLLVLDTVHAAHGPALAGQIYAMVELAVGVGAGLAGKDGSPADAPDVDRRSRESPASPHTSPSSSPHRPGGDDDDEFPPLRASDVVHVRLTDTALEITNRSLQRIAVRVGLGSVREPGRVVAVFEGNIDPGRTHSESTDAVPGFGELAAPTAVLRHWSHGSAEVYEGGERCITEVDLALLDASGAARATGRYDVPNGLDFSVTARQLSALMGQGTTPAVLPEPAAPTVRATGVDLLDVLRSALASGADLLARAGRG